MFADRAKIYIRSGKGGDGHVSFRRELYVPNGGPDGGDGGRGGDVIFEVDEGLNTLQDFRHRRKYTAKDGEPGGKRRCHGKDAEDIILRVPEGTVVREAESGKCKCIAVVLLLWENFYGICIYISAWYSSDCSRRKDFERGYCKD